MATFEQITGVRLAINDPADVIDFESVATLPATLEPQRGYYLQSNSRYYVEDETSPVRLYVSDAQISASFDAGGKEQAVYDSIRLIIAKIGREITLVQDKSGADSSEFTSLRDTLAYYEKMLALAQDDIDKAAKTDTGQFARVARPVIAGGDL